MGFGRWRTPRWLRRRARASRREAKLAQALAATRFVTVATIVDAYHDAPSRPANDDCAPRGPRRTRPRFTVVR